MIFLFMALTIGFHEQYYLPRLKRSFFKNITLVDSMMEKHLQLLKLHGADF
jgi:hypothetical protein